MKRIAFIFLTALLLTGGTSCELFPPFPGNGGDDPKEKFLYLATNCPDGDVEKYDENGNLLCTEEDGLDPDLLTILSLRCAPEERRPNPCPPIPPTQISDAKLPILDFQILVHTPDPSQTSAQILNSVGKSFAESSENIISYDQDTQFATINFNVVDEGLLDDELVIVVNTAYLNGQQNIKTLSMSAELKSGAFTLD